MEDDKLLGKSLERGLGEAGHACTWVRSGEQALVAVRQHKLDAIVLDLMLPDLDGFQVLQALRASGARTPVLILTALGSVDDRVKGLDGGADDYLVKPFAFAELLARLHALQRRSAARPAMLQEVGNLRLDLGTRKASQDGRTVDLSPTEFSILEFMMRHSGQVVTRNMLHEHIWGDAWDGTTNVVDVHINHLRRKIDGKLARTRIQTVRGQGYVLRPD